MDILKFAGSETTYEGEVLELSENKIVVNFATGIPADCDMSTVQVLDSDGNVTAEKTGYSTVYQRKMNTLILSNDGSVCSVDNSNEDIEALRAEKKAEISSACQAAIHYGIDVNGEHFALTDNDQTNLFGKQVQLAAGATQAEYHADGQPCRYFTAEEMTAIITAATAHVTYHTTYCNALNMWIAAAETAEELESIYYGVEVPEAYQSEVLVNLLSA